MKDATVMAILIPERIIVIIMKDRTIKKSMTEVTGATEGAAGINFNSYFEPGLLSPVFLCAIDQ